MKKFLSGLVLGIALSVAGLWYLGDRTRAQRMQEDMQAAADQTKDFVRDKVDSLNLSAEEISNEMAHAGQVVRNKAESLGTSIANTAADTQITAEVKARLLADSELASLSISVSTTDGKVTLSGSASSPDEIARAVKIAISVDGVKQVVSTLQLKQ
jgi:osmotically-inducible protein OsmY